MALRVRSRRRGGAGWVMSHDAGLLRWLRAWETCAQVSRTGPAIENGNFMRKLAGEPDWRVARGAFAAGCAGGPAPGAHTPCAWVSACSSRLGTDCGLAARGPGCRAASSHHLRRTSAALFSCGEERPVRSFQEAGVFVEASF